MADEPNTPPGSPSGSRWEPDPGETPTTEALAAPSAARSAGPDSERRAHLRGRAVLAGAATALALGGGLTGFVIGHSTAGGDDLRPAKFSGPGPGGQFGGQPGPGQQPPASFGNREGDGYDGRPDRDDDGTGTGSDAGSGTAGTSSGTTANPT